MSGYKKVANLDEIPLGKMKSFSVGFDRILICHTDDGVFAMPDECTHDGAPFDGGLLNRQGHIICPRHGAKFDCRNGEVKAPPAVINIDTYPIKLENNEIFVDID